jgi:phosphoribosylglycinamide formyltransferase 2
MPTLGTPYTSKATRLMLLGSGELGKEVAIEAQRFGVEVIAVDRYPQAPAMQVAHRSHVVDMLDGDELRKLIEAEKPDYIVPEIEAIATETLLELEKQNFNVIPTARAARLTMDREGIRCLAAEQLDVVTSAYKFADTEDEFNAAIAEIGIPCVVKPVMSSSGKGQSLVKTKDDIDKAWEYSQLGGRTGEGGRVIVEGFVDFDYEITLLTVRHIDGTSFCAPIGHYQEDGDYRQSWQPQAMSEIALKQAQQIAQKITGNLGGFGIFGVEFFIKDDQAIFSEVSPRPHDTGMVTMASQNLSQFALHVRAILGLPIPTIIQYSPAASAVILAEGDSHNICYQGVREALSQPNTYLRLFGKPKVKGRRRVGVALATAETPEAARKAAEAAANKIKIVY